MRSSLPFVVGCPSCGSEFPVDPAKLPADGVPAICSACQRVFPVMPPGPDTTDASAFEARTDPPGPEPSLDEPPAPEGTPRPAAGTSEADTTALESQGPTEPKDPPATPDDWSPFEDLSSLATDVGAQTRSDEEAGKDTPPAGPSLSQGMARFGRRDAHERARHLARVLVSDIIAYHPARYQESLTRGTLKDDFEAEVQKSWKEYVDQVGAQMAESTPYFNQALNQVLAKGEEVF